MAFEDRAWTPIVAERETSNRPPAQPFPCRGEMNRYTGCIGARRCRGQGVSMCILGRWPDERQISAPPERHVAPVGVTPLPRTAAPVEPAPVARPPRPTSDRVRFLVGVVHRDRQVRQIVGKHLQGAGYRSLGCGSLAAALAALAEDEAPAALLVDGTLLQSDPANERLLAETSAAAVPVLSLPAGLRAHTSVESAVRMAAVWLTVTLRPELGARRAG
jgi:hypothetical protein